MWIDSRGSDVLYHNECERLLALAAGGTGHLGIIIDGAPAVFPLNYGVAGTDIIIKLGHGMILETLRHEPMVAFQVDRGPDDALKTWSVLAKGPAKIVENASVLDEFKHSKPFELVQEPGSTFVRIRTQSLTGRRFIARTYENDLNHHDDSRHFEGASS